MKITSAQAAALERLFDQGYSPGDTFNPYDAFPARNARDNGARRALEGLRKHRVLVGVKRPTGHLMITDYTVRKYDER